MSFMALSKATQPSPPPSLTSSRTGSLYFAYGSNLSAVQMSLRLQNSPDSSVPVALARLDNYKWIICERGYANVVPVPSPPTSRNGGSRDNSNTEDENIVWGILYSMSAADEEALDQYEGHNSNRNPDPEPNPDINQRIWKPYLQGSWDYNKHYLNLTVTKWFRNPKEYGIDIPSSSPSSKTHPTTHPNATHPSIIPTPVRALVYVDEHRILPGTINAEYIGRMNRGIAESTALGLPKTWVDKVMRKWIPEGVFVDDERYVGTDQGYLEEERAETREEVRERVARSWRQ